ncbi:MAG: hypothetical protein ACFB12_17615 [Leptolyngbyaceae cyanobacterium]
MIPEGHHLETRLKKDKSSAPKRGPGVIVLRTIAVSVSVPLTFTLVDTLLGFDPEINVGVQERSPEGVTARPDVLSREEFITIGDSVPNSSEESATSEDSILDIDENSGSSENLDAGSNQESEPERPLAESDSDERSSENSREHWVQIPRYCNGLYAGSANFRASPSLLPSEIKGVVIVGQWVSLTGQTAYGDGILWYESVNQTALNASAEPEARNQLNAGQPGWLAACFVG